MNVQGTRHIVGTVTIRTPALALSTWTEIFCLEQIVRNMLWVKCEVANVPLHGLCDDFLKNGLTTNRVDALADDNSKSGVAIVDSLAQGALRPINSLSGSEAMHVDCILLLSGIQFVQS